MTVIQRVVKPTTHKGKKFLQKREPKVIEDPKQTIFLKGRKTSNIVINCLKDIHSLKKPDVVMLGQKKDILPFENATHIEKLCNKYNTSLFVFGTSNKKRPNNIVIGRTYDGHLLDMIELGIVHYKSLFDFETEKVATGIKPCLLFAGEKFESNSDLARLKNLFIDFFQREPVTAVRLQGLEHVIMFTAEGDNIYLRSYRIILKKSGIHKPRVELEEIGPSIDFTLRRTKLASDDLFKTSCKKPKELKIRKTKNISKNVFGTTEGRIHIPKQNLSRLQTRRMKGFKKTKNEKIKGKKELKKRKIESGESQNNKKIKTATNSSNNAE